MATDYIGRDPVKGWQITKVSRVVRVGGIIGGTIVGGVVSGIAGFVQGLFDKPCLSPNERFRNGLNDFGYGTLGSLAGGLATAGALTLGATPLLAFGVGVGIGIAASEIITYYRDTGDLQDIF